MWCARVLGSGHRQDVELVSGMYRLSRKTLRAAVWLMLALLTLQGSVVVREMTAELSGSFVGETLSEVLPDSQSLAEGTAAPCDLAGDDDCNQCCHCHGHGSHVMAVTSGSDWSIQLAFALPISRDASFLPPLISNIHRPPIV